ncbi:unnamed protein product [Nippostrongylus brasiliensis]|uniref:SCP domain-containing protein n=1 Tax=Nippostrongylus brasiliensis TaxID=27835 RepID=A0A0N4XT50_NIPBR|nr:unnamed protein product [Nippostrongylus brasiliensis]
MHSISLLCLLPVVAAYIRPPPCGVSYEEGEAYKAYAERVKYGLIASCNLFREAEKALWSGYSPDLENGIKYWVTKSTEYKGSPKFVTVLKQVMAEMPTSLDGRVKTYGCAYSLEYGANGKNTFHVGCLFSRRTYYYGRM